MKQKINDNKTIRADSIKLLINSLMQVEVKSFTQPQKTILNEVLNNGKSFAELKDIVNLTTARQRTVLANSVNIFSNYIKAINDRQKEYEETKKELAELKHWKQSLEVCVEKEKAIDPKLKKKLSIIVQDAGFSNRILGIFFANDIFAVSDIVKYSKRNIAGLRNCGDKCIKEIEDYLEKNELSWSMKI